MVEESVLNVTNGLGTVEAGLDLDKDSTSSLSIELNYAEGAAEIFGKLQGGEISFSGKARLENGVVIFGIDLDNDGEESVKVKLNIAEALKEATSALK